MWEDGKLVVAVCWARRQDLLPHPVQGHGLALISWLIFLHSHNSGKAFPPNTNHIYVLLMLVFNAEVNYGLHEMH